MPAEPSKAVFLSYASQDAEAARRICESLRSGGVEVWFDAEGGLEHGDAWDAKIRRLIGKECVRFIPLISASTQARHEGYFRLEWELAAERAMSIASGVAFMRFGSDTPKLAFAQCPEVKQQLWGGAFWGGGDFGNTEGQHSSEGVIAAQVARHGEGANYHVLQKGQMDLGLFP